MKKASNTLLLVGAILSCVYAVAFLIVGIFSVITPFYIPAVFFVLTAANVVNAVLAFFAWRKPNGGLLLGNIIFGFLSLAICNLIGAILDARTAKFVLFKRKYLAIPYFAFLVLFVIVPIIIIVFYAFTDTLEDGSLTFSFVALVDFFTSPTKINVLLVSLFFGVMNTLICLLIGYPLAYLLSNTKVNKNYVMVMLFVMPMWINFVLRTGATRDVLNFLGLTGGSYPYTATMIGMVYNYLPFTILPLYTTMIKLDKSQIEAAKDLGCNGFRTFTKSILPQSIPGIISAAEMVFMPTMSSYVISDTLSEGKLTLFGNIIYLHFSQSMWNQGSFMALIMLIFIFLMMFLTRKSSGDDEPQRGAGLW